jgi:hypothetical protein
VLDQMAACAPTGCWLNDAFGSKAVLSIEVATFRGWFSYESTAAAPLLRTTALIAAAMLSGAQIASIS